MWANTKRWTTKRAPKYFFPQGKKSEQNQHLLNNKHQPLHPPTRFNIRIFSFARDFQGREIFQKVTNFVWNVSRYEQKRPFSLQRKISWKKIAAEICPFSGWSWLIHPAMRCVSSVHLVTQEILFFFLETMHNFFRHSLVAPEVVRGVPPPDFLADQFGSITSTWGAQVAMVLTCPWPQRAGVRS